MSAIDFSRSRVILVGTSHYTAGLEQMEAAANSLTEMHALLSGPLCNWPKSRITSLLNKSTRDGVDQRIATLIHDTADVLLFYYVGHGQLLDGEDLGLALADTHRDPRMRYTTSLRLSHLRHELKYRCTARVQVVILDCCFAGLATRNSQGDDLAKQVRQITKVEGAYTLAASRSSQKALHQDGPDGLTYFTKILTEVVHDGIPSAGPHLALNDLHTEISTRFRHLDLPEDHLRPEPTTLAVDTAEELLLARNAAWTPHISDEPPAAQAVVKPAAAPRGKRRTRPATPGAHYLGPYHRPPQPQAHTKPGLADIRAAPVTLTRPRLENARTGITIGFFSTLLLLGVIIGGEILNSEIWGSSQITNQEWRSLPAIIVGFVFGSVLIGMIWGACYRRIILTIGPDGLAIEKRTMRRSTSTTMAIRWNSVHHVSLMGAGRGSILVAWTENGHPPHPSIPLNHRVKGGWWLCAMSTVTVSGGEDEQLAYVRDALAYFGGDKYTQP
ncbi:caspase domain-containing protein [Amycolatopsis sp. lyj-108]|uniref:caspase family protein n=1 Tax=Amycolatopsis sp. lyj-108 TaxID=2789286 RepID=UPI00397D7CD3